jgi:hypothetical protein
MSGSLPPFPPMLSWDAQCIVKMLSKYGNEVFVFHMSLPSSVLRGSLRLFISKAAIIRTVELNIYHNFNVNGINDYKILQYKPTKCTFLKFIF